MITLTDGELGLKLKLLIEVKKINRKELANKMNAILSNENKKPITEDIIRAYELGRRNFSFIFVAKLCEVLKVDIRYFTEDLSKLMESKDNLSNIFDSRKNASLHGKFNNLVKILDKISEREVADDFLKFLSEFGSKK